MNKTVATILVALAKAANIDPDTLASLATDEALSSPEGFLIRSIAQALRDDNAFKSIHDAM
jgi:hypothetical protein